MYLIAVATLFAVWLLATLVSQRDGRLQTLVRDADRFLLIPRWTFFAPNPGTTDHHLLYRDALDDEACTPWREIPVDDRRGLLAAIWNPEKRNGKAITDATNSLLIISREIDADGLKTTLPYLALVNYISAIPRSQLVQATQFMVMESFGSWSDRAPRPVVRSEFHALPQQTFVTPEPWAPLEEVAR